MLHKALSDAVKWRIIAVNPASAATPPKTTNPEMQTLQVEEAVALIQVVADTKYHIPVVLALTTGMRRGEIFGVKWDDLDFGAGLLYVRRSLQDVKGQRTFKAPKTAAGTRVIALSDIALVALRQHKGHQAQDKLLIGDMYQDHGLICCQADGSPVNLDSFSSTFIRFLRSRKLKIVRFHNLRHTNVTLLAQGGVHMKVISARLGHSNISITMDTYGHVVPPMERDAAKRIDEALGW